MVAEARDDAGVRVVRLVGEIDISNADALGEKLDRVVGDGHERLVADLSGLEFMDSSGIAMLLRAAKRVESITVRNPAPVVRRIIECTGLADILPIEP
jgi:anti-anti-sigma factor